MIFLNRFSIAPADAALMVVPASRTSPRVIAGSWWMADGCGCAMIVNGTSSSFFLFGSTSSLLFLCPNKEFDGVMREGCRESTSQ